MSTPDVASRDVEERVAVAIVRHGSRVLVGRRPAGRPWAGYLEFPGGRVQPEESWEAAAFRETLEETGLAITIRRHLASVQIQYDYARLEIRFFLADPAPQSNPRPREPFFWKEVSELNPDQFPPANSQIIATLRACVGDPGPSSAF